MALVPCPSCRRHVRDLAEVCPFCGRARESRRVEQARPRTQLSRGALFAFASIVSVSAGCSSESESLLATNPPGPVDSGVADGATQDTGARTDSAVIDSGAPTDSGPTDSGAPTDSGSATDSSSSDAIDRDDGGPAPPYGLPPPS